jgi:hypothetical protein
MSATQIHTSREMRGRGKAARTLELEQAIVAIVDERHPITVRGVCYALFTRGLIASMAVGETQKVSRIMTEMRELDALDWTLIVDGSRSVDRASLWRDPEEIIEAAVKTYRRDNWQEQPALVEVWSEKSTVAGVLAPVLAEYGVPFRVMKGFGSFTAVRQAAEDSLQIRDDKRGVVLYLGDWDPSGLYMSEVDLPKRLDRYGSLWRFERIAVLQRDLAGLPSFPVATKRDDRRFDWYRAHTTGDPSLCWELDAMNPNDLRDRVQSSIQGYMDVDAWQRSLCVEGAKVESMREFHQAWASMSRKGARS